MRVGVISDTHGLLRPEALAALSGSACVIHAGDIGKPDVLDGLSRIAPVHAIRGNNDVGPWAAELPDTLTLELGGIGVHVIHDVKALAREALQAQVRVVICGHSHVPRIHSHGPILYLNPGSAGPRRFRLPVCVALLEIAQARPRAAIVELALR